MARVGLFAKYAFYALKRKRRDSARSILVYVSGKITALTHAGGGKRRVCLNQTDRLTPDDQRQSSPPAARPPTTPQCCFLALPGIRRLHLHQPVPDGYLDQISHGTGLKLGKQVVFVRFHGLGADMQIRRDGFDAFAVGQQPENLFFAR